MLQFTNFYLWVMTGSEAVAPEPGPAGGSPPKHFTSGHCAFLVSLLFTSAGAQFTAQSSVGTASVAIVCALLDTPAGGHVRSPLG